jgi:ABC-type phosphate/phosphonate transport system permease subunit
LNKILRYNNFEKIKKFINKIKVTILEFIKKNIIYYGEKENMSLILGMDMLVFIAWIGTILATILCVIYGIYYQFFKKTIKEKPLKVKDEKSQIEEVE